MDLGVIPSNNGGVREVHLIDWLSGTKEDMFSLPKVQKAIQTGKTYSAGVRHLVEKWFL